MSHVPPSHLRRDASARTLPPGAGFLLAAFFGALCWALLLALIV